MSLIVGRVCLLRIKLCLFLLSFFNIVFTQQDGFSIGVIADCQYCRDPGSGIRKYALSKSKLSTCVRHFNSLNLEYVIHLGDFIDRDFESFSVVKPIFDSLKAPSYHVLGNHEFSVEDQYKAGIPSLLGMPANFYHFDLNGWRFVVLDGNDLSFHAYPEGSLRYQQTSLYYESNKITSPKWNGALDVEQLSWLNSIIREANESDLNVVLYCHFPVFPENVHNLWNAGEVLSILRNYPCVKAFINGHNHEGNYAILDGIHFLTMKGMVDSEQNAYAVLRFNKNTITVDGYGREEARVLTIR